MRENFGAGSILLKREGGFWLNRRARDTRLTRREPTRQRQENGEFSLGLRGRCAGAWR